MRDPLPPAVDPDPKLASPPPLGVCRKILALNLSARRASKNQSPVGAGSQKLVLFTIWAMGSAPTTMQEIADRAGISYTQCSRAVLILRDLGLLRIASRQRRGPGVSGAPRAGYEVCIGVRKQFGEEPG